MTKILLATLAALSLDAGRSTLDAQSQHTLMPVPTRVVFNEGRLRLDSTITIALIRHRDGRLERAVGRALARMEGRIAAPLSRAYSRNADGAGIVVDVAGPGQAVQGLDEDESYTLDVNSSLATLRAATVVGAIRGLETVLQLVESDERSFYLPATAISDAPRFRWRGLLVDVCRHWQPPEVIKRTLDGMAAVKLNVLHWHLSEDQGFRVESKRFPKLHELGSDGNYYTQAQIKEIVAYARDRGIRVLPEFDMPGHSTAWLVGYPQYASRSGPISIRREWGGADAIFDPTQEATYTFIDRFIGEMVTLFPDPYWHIGGDEVEDKHWNNNPRIVAWRKARGYANNAALQAHFNRRLSSILAKYSKRMVGWDEIIHPRLPARTVVQSWRGTQYLGETAQKGIEGILSAPYYLDHIKTAEEMYLADPIPFFTDLTPAQQRFVLGGEAAMWGEHITPEMIDSRIWPRMAAIAERFWSPQKVNDVGDMYRRLNVMSARLEQLGLGHESHVTRMLRRLTNGDDVAPLAAVLDVAMPPSFSQRVRGPRIVQMTPLTRIQDAARPDPRGRWEAERLSQRIVTERDTARANAINALAVRFDALVRAQLPIREQAKRSPLITQALPAVDGAARVAQIGLEALGYLRGTRAPPGWSEASLVELKRLEEPQALLRISIVPAVRRLVNAATPPLP